MPQSTQPRTGVTSEMLVTLPLPRGYTYAGMVDHIEDGVLIDWKTTATPADYATTLPLRLQADCYALAAREAGHVITDVQYRMVARPSLRMKSAPKPTIRQKKDEPAEAFAARCDEWRATNPAETPAEFEDRCFEWLTTNEGVVAEETIHLNEARLQAAMRMMNAAAMAADAISASERDAEMNPSACSRYGRTCEYVDLCAAKINGGDWRDVATERFGSPDQSAKVHPELPDPYTTDRRALTYSGMAARADCEQRFSFRYLAGLVRDHDGEPEAIRVGSLFHKGVEVYGRTGDLNSALEAIDSLADEIPAIGDMVARHSEMAAKARAMVRAAAIKWPVEDQWGRVRDLANDVISGIEARDEIPLGDIIARARALIARLDRIGTQPGSPHQPTEPPPDYLGF